MPSPSLSLTTFLFGECVDSPINFLNPVHGAAGNHTESEPSEYLASRIHCWCRFANTGCNVPILAQVIEPQKAHRSRVLETGGMVMYTRRAARLGVTAMFEQHLLYPSCAAQFA